MKNELRRFPNFAKKNPIVMKKLMLVCILGYLSISCAQEPTDPTIYGNSITSEELKTLLYEYASDKFEGRETGKPGHDLATNYLQEKYIEMNVSSPFGNGDYLQEVPLERRKLAESELSINGVKLSIYDDYIPPRNVNIPSLNLNQVVYVGFGIDDENYSDYKNIDVKNKVVIVKSGEPLNTDSIYAVTGTKDKSRWNSGSRARGFKIEAAKKLGAKAIFIMDNSGFNYYSKSYKRIDPVTYEGRILEDSSNDTYFSVLIGEDVAKQIYSDIKTNHTPQLVDTNINLSFKKNVEKFNSHNVVSFIEGDEKPDEIIVISSHLDHNGVEENGKVFNGADDDGSGTVAMLEIAQAFKQAVEDGYRPKRSILFLHLTAEEKGLLGSKYYTDLNPIFPLENTVANLNIDMIGRVDKLHEKDRNYVYVIGADMLSTELYDINETVNKAHTNIKLDYRYSDYHNPNNYYYRSDHYNFAKHNIPVAFYFNGQHDDYHKVSDTPDKIEYDLLENRTRLVFFTAWELANRKNRIIADKAEKSK